MATMEESVGAALAAQCLAFATIEALIKLGHQDVLEQVKSQALESLSASVPHAEGFDREKVLEHGRTVVFGLTETGKVKATLDGKLSQ